MRKPFTLKLKDRVLPLGRQSVIMGILNVTPDSFSDGGQFYAFERAIAQAQTMLASGATIIDIGGESTRPGGAPVPLEEELARVIPVVESLSSLPCLISIDTQKAEVADRALAAGAHLVNDVTALFGDPDMAAVVSKHEAAVCLMHNAVLYRGSKAPGSFQEFGGEAKADLRDLGDLPMMEAIATYLKRSLQIAQKAGIPDDRILLDPGFGFGVTAKENLQIFNALKRLFAMPYPWLIGLSRKRFVQALTQGDDSIDEVTAMLGQKSAFAGAHVIRVHDVATQKRFLDVADTVMEEAL